MEKVLLRFTKNILVLFMMSSSLGSIEAQTSFHWARNMGGSQNDYGKSITTDASGNVYTTGSFLGTADFDPGPGVYNMTAIGSRDAFVSTLDASGNFIWAKQFGGFASFAGVAGGNSIITDPAGNIYVAGEFFYTVDFDPGSGVFNLSTSGGNYDIFISKLDASGNFVWAKQVGGSQNEEVYSITLDNSSNVYMTGGYIGVVDFDPGAGTYTLSSPNGAGYVLKLTLNGVFAMVRPLPGTGLSSKVDASGNIYTSGAFGGTAVDFDPGPGTYTLSDFGGADSYIQKLDNSGNFLWAAQLGGPGSEQGTSLSVDANGNVFSTGYFQGVGDFDPGINTYTLASFGANSLDVYISKLDASGNFIWAKQLGGSQTDTPNSLTLDASNNVYTTGGFNGPADFDPGAGTYTLNCLGGNAVFISKLDASGNFVWANGFSYSNSFGRGITVTPYYEVYTTGNFDQNTDFDPGAGTYTLNPNGGGGSSDVFVHKLSQNACPTFSVNSTTSGYTLMCSLNTLTLNAVNTSTFLSVTYTWTTPSLTTTTGSSYTCTAAGIYTVAASVPSNTCIVTQTLSIIQSTGNVNFNVNTGGVTCFSNGSATVSNITGTSPYTFTWSSGGNSQSTGGLAVGNYSVTVFDGNQCSATQTFAINNVTPSFSSVPICFVTVDSLSQHNVITWDKTQFPNADSFFVYREIGTNVYSKIDARPYGSLSRFVDTVKTLYFPNTGNPNVGTYRYKLKTMDSCGNYSSFSPYHNTLFTVNNNGTFSWTQLYTIEGTTNPVLAYILERDNTSNGSWQAIGSVAGTQQFIIDPNYSTYQSTATWRVRTQWSISCVPTLKSTNANSDSYSNQVSNLTIGIKENNTNANFAVYPQPASQQLFILTESAADFVSVKVTDLTGKQLMEQRLKVNDNKAQLNVEGLAKGIYILQLNCNGKVLYKKITIAY